jgi:hypothetical protein
MSQQESKNGGMLFKVLTGVLVIAVAALIFWSLNTKKELNGMIVEKEAQKVELQSQLDGLMKQHNQLKKENGELSESLTEKDSIIQAKATEIEDALKYKWSYYKINKQFKELQKVTQGYVRQIDELKEANIKLANENTVVKSKFAAEQQKTAKLTQIKKDLSNQVDKASVIKSFKVVANGVRVKSNGKERITNKISRINKIKISFSLIENVIAKAGPKEIFIRIAGPDNKILTKGHGDEFAFDYKGEKLQYSIAKKIDYKNEAIDVDTYWTKRDSQKLIAGEYKVEIYEDENVIGHANFKLR